MRSWRLFAKGWKINATIGAVGTIAAFSTIDTAPLSVIADNKKSKSLRIAIIGSGVGGASTAYFLRELLNKYNKDDTSSIDMYEKNNCVGGRVKSVNLEEYCGGSYNKDIGATIMIKQNQYIHHFATNLLGLPLIYEGDSNDPNRNLGFAFFDEPRGKLSQVWDERFGTLKLIKQWGFLHFINLMRCARQFVANFGQIYDLQKNEKCFENAIDLWTALNLGDTLYGNGMEYVNKEINKFIPSFLQRQSIAKHEYAPSTLQLVTALTRNNYTQQPDDLPPLVVAGAVSTLAANGLCYVADGGNSLIEKGLIEKSETKLHLNCKIEHIEKSENGKYVLNKDGNLEYDYVIIAAPLSLTKINIDIESKQIDILQQQRYVDVYKHYVKGKLSSEYLGFDDENDQNLSAVGAILSSNLGDLSEYDGVKRETFKKLPCTTIQTNASNDWITFMGSERMSEDVLSEVMVSWEKESLQRFHFKAYPEFKWNRSNIDCLSMKQQKEILSFCVDKNEDGGLYYLNVLECGMSAQEILAVAGKNVALLVSKQINS